MVKRMLSEMELISEISKGPSFKEESTWFAEERRNTYETVNMNRLGDMIFPYNHETLEGYSMQRHEFVRNMDMNITKCDNLDNFNKMIVEVAEEVYKITIVGDVL